MNPSNNVAHYKREIEREKRQQGEFSGLFVKHSPLKL
jgi:hypothetical protein